jgi:ABC-type glutathione transport system ATPase component
MARIDVPALSLVVLVGVSGSGKSTFARKHFLGTEVISSDFCRGRSLTTRTIRLPPRMRSMFCTTSPANVSPPAG